MLKSNFSRNGLLKSVACALALTSGAASAVEVKFDDPDIIAFIDTTFTASAAMRVKGQHHFGTADPTGNVNLFRDAGDVYSTPLSLLTDVGISKDGFGVFARFSYIYDYTIRNKDCTNCERPNVWPYPAGGTGSPASSVLHRGSPSAQTVDGIADDAQNLAGKKFTLYDLFVFGSWDIDGHPLNARVGKQVISWGESNIQGGGISQMMNPTDLSKATTPGTDVKETLIPQESIYFNFGLNDNISLEAYYTWNWRNSTFIGVGTMFSPFDFLGAGYNPDLFVRGIEKSGDEEPSGGQWGVNMHFIIPQWNFADLGVYWVRSHAYSPYIGLNENYTPRPDPAEDGNPLTLAGYQWIYGEDQNTYAISLNGEAPFDSSFAMEVNLKENFYDTRECRNLYGVSGVGVPDLGGIPVGALFGFGVTGAGNLGTQGVIPGCDIGASNVYTFLGNLTRSVGTDFLGADKLNMVFDMSAVWMDDLESGDPTDRVNVRPESPTRQSNAVVDPGRYPGVDGLDRPITDFAWGYTAVAGLEYNNLFWNLTVSPTLIFVHNVEGYTPFQGGSLVENQRTIVSKVSFTYLGGTSVDLQYVTWLGTAGTNDDRDNVSIVFKHSF